MWDRQQNGVGWITAYTINFWHSCDSLSIDTAFHLLPPTTTLHPHREETPLEEGFINLWLLTLRICEEKKQIEWFEPRTHIQVCCLTCVFLQLKSVHFTFSRCSYTDRLTGPITVKCLAQVHLHIFHLVGWGIQISTIRLLAQSS